MGLAGRGLNESPNNSNVSTFVASLSAAVKNLSSTCYLDQIWERPATLRKRKRTILHFNVQPTRNSSHDGNRFRRCTPKHVVWTHGKMSGQIARTLPGTVAVVLRSRECIPSVTAVWNYSQESHPHLSSPSRDFAHRDPILHLVLILRVCLLVEVNLVGYGRGWRRRSGCILLRSPLRAALLQSPSHPKPSPQPSTPSPCGDAGERSGANGENFFLLFFSAYGGGHSSSDFAFA
jgi:hypothetical protein